MFRICSSINLKSGLGNLRDVALGTKNKNQKFGQTRTKGVNVPLHSPTPTTKGDETGPDPTETPTVGGVEPETGGSSETSGPRALSGGRGVF